jgi:L-amino acid N-acyltransferase YncA
MTRDATEGDLPAILAIANEVIAHSTAIYLDEPFTLDDRRQWMLGRQAQGFPVVVEVDQGEVVGFSSFGEFRPYWGYRHTVEHSVHIRADQRGRGVGRRLVEALFPRAAALGKHVMLGAIDADNAGSIAFHEKLGFERAATLREVGRKFDRWLDLVFMQKLM